MSMHTVTDRYMTSWYVRPKMPWWRDAMMLYFQTFSNMPIPADCTPPQYTIDELRNFRLRLSIYETPALDKLPEYA